MKGVGAAVTWRGKGGMGYLTALKGIYLPGDLWARGASTAIVERLLPRDNSSI
jgi:hypothetical protein